MDKSNFAKLLSQLASLNKQQRMQLSRALENPPNLRSAP